LARAEENAVRCPDEAVAEKMSRLIMQVKAEGDTVGGVIACVVRGCPVGLGEPVFDKLHARLGAAMLSINAVKGFEYGLGFAGASGRGSEQNDIFEPDGKGGITVRTNNSGGIQGGISNGQDIYFRVAFKPVATLLREQETVDNKGNSTTLTARGRHDACVLPRAVPVVEAMAAITILDAYLLDKSTQMGK
jgi:chorismate synthase